MQWSTMDPWNETDDFWNESTSKKFNFNDEEDVCFTY